MRGEEGSASERYAQWKSMKPVLYDWFILHSLAWPSLSCQWGPQLEQGTYLNCQRLYLSERTDGGEPNTLIIANCEIVKPRVADAEHIAEFDENARFPFVKKYKIIVHPGEVNKIRELRQSDIVATLTDSPNVLIRDVKARPKRYTSRGAEESKPDMILTGHQDSAEFALATCPIEPFVLSGGKDKLVVLWSIHDHVSTLAADLDSSETPGSSARSIKNLSKASRHIDKPLESSSIGPRGIYIGHEDSVGDVELCPSRSSV